MTIFLFEITTDGSDLEGEQFFVQAEDFEEALLIAKDNFGDEDLECIDEGFTDEEAEMIGLDTY